MKKVKFLLCSSIINLFTWSCDNNNDRNIDVEKLIKNNGKLRHDNDILSSQIEELLMQIRVGKRRIQEAKDNVAKLECEKNAVEQRYKNLNEQLEKARYEVGRLETGLQEAKDNVAKLECEKNAVEQRYKNSNEQLEKARYEVGRLETGLQEAKDNVAKLECEKNAVEQERENLRKQLEEEQGKVSVLENMEWRRAGNTRKVERKCSRLETENGRLREKLKEMEEKMDKVDFNIKSFSSNTMMFLGQYNSFVTKMLVDNNNELLDIHKILQNMVMYVSYLNEEDRNGC